MVARLPACRYNYRGMSLVFLDRNTSILKLSDCIVARSSRQVLSQIQDTWSSSKSISAVLAFLPSSSVSTLLSSVSLSLTAINALPNRFIPRSLRSPPPQLHQIQPPPAINLARHHQFPLLVATNPCPNASVTSASSSPKPSPKNYAPVLPNRKIEQ